MTTSYAAYAALASETYTLYGGHLSVLPLLLAFGAAALVLLWNLFYALCKDMLWVGKIRAVTELVRLLLQCKQHGRKTSSEAGKKWSYADEWEGIVDKGGDVIQFVCADDDRSVSRLGLDFFANRIANWGTGELGLKQKDTVALMMLNRPDLVAVWLGMAKIGVSTALINTNVTGAALLYSITLAVQTSTCKVLLLDSELETELAADIKALRAAGCTVLLWDELEGVLQNVSDSRPSRALRCDILESDALLYIYTSGTTGLPKAGKISHTRYLFSSFLMPTFCYLQSGQSVYCCLPLYHSAGGMMGAGGCLRSGATMVLKRKFSVRTFSADILKYQCSSVQYIGELCSYLVNAPPNPLDASLQLGFAFGNGLRPDIWTKFQCRYKVRRVVEFYSATEGNVSLFNTTGRVGALGFIPPRLADLLYPVKLLRVDPEDKSKPLRESGTKSGKGECRMAAYEEVGLAVGLVGGGTERRFDGYSDQAANNAKLLRDVLRTGDCYFNSGDLLRRDSQGFYYWSDRVGDTFRWKGENVATTEVSLVMSQVPSSPIQFPGSPIVPKDSQVPLMFTEVVVYGVGVPMCDGRAGMAAVVLSPHLSLPIDWAPLTLHLHANLPPYARPLFIRVRKEMTVTSTFKHQRGDMVGEGWDQSKCGGDLLFLCSKEGVAPLTPLLAQQIQTGVLRL